MKMENKTTVQKMSMAEERWAGKEVVVQYSSTNRCTEEENETKNPCNHGSMWKWYRDR